MKYLIVSVAGLGWRDLRQRKMTRMAGLEFTGAESAFPAVTSVAQASLRTGVKPKSHGMTSNGHFSRDLRKASFGEQSSALVKGARIWDDAGAAAECSVAMMFFRQSLGESAQIILSPAPIRKYNGGMIGKLYSQPPELERALGRFRQHNYWGPMASAAIGDDIIASAEFVIKEDNPDFAFLHLPSLDYDLQRHGPEHPKSDDAFDQIEEQLERLAEIAVDHGSEIVVLGDYAITEVTAPPKFPNIELRKAGFFQTREVNGMSYPDLHNSRAFAMCDHEIAHIYTADSETLEFLEFMFKHEDGYEKVEVRAAQDWAHASAGELLLTAKKGSWCAYPWWENKREAPDYASRIDIRNKPGYDPCELFFGGFFPPRISLDATRVRGTHGRECEVAFASSKPLPSLPPFPSPDEIGAALKRAFDEEAAFGDEDF